MGWTLWYPDACILDMEAFDSEPRQYKFFQMHVASQRNKELVVLGRANGGAHTHEAERTTTPLTIHWHTSKSMRLLK